MIQEQLMAIRTIRKFKDGTTASLQKKISLDALMAKFLFIKYLRQHDNYVRFDQFLGEELAKSEPLSCSKEEIRKVFYNALSWWYIDHRQKMKNAGIPWAEEPAHTTIKNLQKICDLIVVRRWPIRRYFLLQRNYANAPFLIREITELQQLLTDEHPPISRMMFNHLYLTVAQIYSGII